jgi:hypothetical protein
MKYFVLVCIAISCLVVMLVSSCQLREKNVSPTYDTMDKLSPDELKWVNYKVGEKIHFSSNKIKDTISFTVEDLRIYNYYQSYHTAVIGRLYLTNLNQQHRITNIGLDVDKNTSSARVINKIDNRVVIILYNSKSATGMFPSINASSGGQCIALDKRDNCATVELPILQNFTVNNKTYQNVYKLQMQFNKNIGATFLYVNRDNGILRIDFEDGEVWERVQ